MRTIKKIPIEPVYVEIIPDILEENKIYISEMYNVAVHNCLCGCGNKAVTPFGIKSKGWQLIKDRGRITFKPSILNTNCPNRYHYIITNSIANVV